MKRDNDDLRGSKYIKNANGGLIVKENEQNIFKNSLMKLHAIIPAKLKGRGSVTKH